MHPQEDGDTAASDIGPRAMIVGVLLCCFIAVGLPYSEFVLRGTQMGLNSSTPAAFFMLFILVALLQPLLGLVRRRWLLRRAELLLVTVMMMMTTAIAARGFVSTAMPMISGVYYFASLENGWEELLIPHIPSWLIPHDPAAIINFYEGQPEGQPVPWGVWLESLGWWCAFMAAFYLVVICTMVILRRQWMEHERLLYPLTQVPLGMIEEETDATARLKPFLKNPVMWTGFAVPFLLHGINALSHYYEFIPSISMIYSLPLAQGTVRFYLRFDCMWMGLAFLVNTGVSFSLWFFYIVAKIQEVVCARIGIFSTEDLDIFSHTFEGPTMGILSHQVMGAMIVLVLLGLWTGRAHLWQVLQHVWRRDLNGDKEEMLSYRSAVIGTALGLVAMSIWLWRSGLPAWSVPIYLFGAFVIFLALTRVIVEAGLASAVQGLSGCGFLASSVGSSSLGAAGVLATGYTLSWAGDLLVFMMAPVANGLRLLHGLQKYRRRILFMMVAALTIGVIGSLYMTLLLGYKHGANNLGFSAWFAKEPFRFARNFILNPTDVHWPGWIWNGVGMGVMALLIWARHHLLWWPFHPIGYLVSGTWILNSVWFSIFMAWLVKAIVLKVTGPSGYRVARWFFLGMVLGQFVAGGFWAVVDGFTGMTGNRIRMF